MGPSPINIALANGPSIMPSALDAQRLQLMDQQTLEAGKQAQALDLANQQQQRQLDADRAQAIAIQQRIQAHVANNTQAVPIAPVQLQPPKIQNQDTGEWVDNPNAGKPIPPGAEPTGQPASAGNPANPTNPTNGNPTNPTNVGPPNSPAATPPFLPQANQASQVHVPYIDLNQLAVDMAKQGYGNHAVALMQTAQDLQTKSLANAKNQILLEEANAQRLGQSTGALMQLYNSGPDGAQKAQQEWQTLGPQLARQGLVDSQTAVAPFNPSWADAQYRRAVGMTGVMGQLKEAAGIQETEAETGEHTALAGEAGARTKLIGVQASLAQNQIDAVRRFANSPQQLMQLADVTAPPDKYPTINRNLKAGIMAAGTMGAMNPAKLPETMEQLFQQARQEIAQMAPEKMKQEVGKAVAISKAERQGDNPAVADVPPGLVAQVTNQALKNENDYTQARRNVEDIGRVLDLADAGNKAAGSALPVMSAQVINGLQGIKRLNRIDIEQAGGEQAGNLWDRLTGKVDKLVAGQPMPQDVRDDLRELQQRLGENSYRSYVQTFQNINRVNHANFQPSQPPPNIRKAPAAKIAVPAPNGKTYYFGSQADADAFKAKAGIQ